MCCYTILCLEGAGSDFIPLRFRYASARDFIPLRDFISFHSIPFHSFHSIPFIPFHSATLPLAIPFHYQCVHTYTIFSGIALLPEFAGNNKSSRVRPCI